VNDSRVLMVLAGSDMLNYHYSCFKGWDLSLWCGYKSWVLCIRFLSDVLWRDTPLLYQSVLPSP